ENVTERYARKADEKGLTKEEAERVEKEGRAFFKADEKDRAKWEFAAELDRLLLRDEAGVRRVVWKAYQAAPLHEARKKDFDEKKVRYKDHVSPYTVREVGKKPDKGWPLVIAMHGGGGVPKKVNDDQWEVMQRYYKDQDSVTGYKYLALRAPNDTWNGF